MFLNPKMFLVKSQAKPRTISRMVMLIINYTKQKTDSGTGPTDFLKTKKETT